MSTRYLLVSDFATLTPNDIAAAALSGVDTISVTNGSVSLTAAQGLACAANLITIVVQPAQTALIVDSETVIAAIAAPDLAALAAHGINGFMVFGLTGAAPISVQAGLTLVVEGTVSALQTIGFGPGGGVLRIDNPGPMAGTVAAFQAAGSIDFYHAGYDGSATAQLASGNLLTITEISGTYQVQLDPAQLFPGASFVVAADGTGGTRVTLTQAPIAALAIVSAGSNVNGVIVGSGGLLEAVSDGIIVGATVLAGGDVQVDGGGTAIASVLNGGRLDVYGAGNGVAVNSGGQLRVANGGIVTSAIIAGGGSADVQSGGALNSVAIQAGGAATIEAGAADYSALVNSGGQATILAGGISYNAVLAGGSQLIGSGGAANSATITGGLQDVFGVASSTLVRNGGTMLVEAGGSVDTAYLDAGSLLDFRAGAQASGFAFLGGGGMLRIAGSTLPSAIITGLVAGASIDLTALQAASGLALLGPNNLLTIALSGGGTATLQLDPADNFAGRYVHIASDGASGTMVTVAANPTGPAESETRLGSLQNGTNILQGSAGTLKVTAAAGATVLLQDGVAVIASATADGSGAAAFDIAGLALGTHALRASVNGVPVSDLNTLTLADPRQTQFVLGAGNGTLVAGDNSSTVYLNTNGAAHVTLGDGNDVIFAATANALITLGNGSNLVLGGSGNQTVTVGGGGDKIYLGGGTNSIQAGGGTNHFIVGDGANAITAGNGRNEIEAGNGANLIALGSGNEYVQAGTGNNTITIGAGTTGAGTSGIQLGDGNNILHTNAGADTIVLGNGNNSVDLGTGADFLRLGSGSNRVTATSGNKEIDLHGGGANSIALGDGANIIYGSGNNSISLGAGNNVIAMIGGANSIAAGDGANAVTLRTATQASSITLGNGRNQVITGLGGATITLGNGDNYIETFGGSNIITAGSGLNVIKGDSGNDTFNVGHGYVHGNGPTDIFNLGAGGGAAYGGWGANSLNLAAGAWYVGAAAGADRIALTGAAAFADVQDFEIVKDLLVLSNAAFGLGIAGLYGTATLAAGALLSTTTDGSFSSADALISYNAANGYLAHRANAASAASVVAVLENHPIAITGGLFVGA